MSDGGDRVGVPHRNPLPSASDAWLPVPTYSSAQKALNPRLWELDSAFELSADDERGQSRRVLPEVPVSAGESRHSRPVLQSQPRSGHVPGFDCCRVGASTGDCGLNRSRLRPGVSDDVPLAGDVLIMPSPCRISRARAATRWETWWCSAIVCAEGMRPVMVPWVISSRSILATCSTAAPPSPGRSQGPACPLHGPLASSAGNPASTGPGRTLRGAAAAGEAAGQTPPGKFEPVGPGRLRFPCLRDRGTRGAGHFTVEVTRVQAGVPDNLVDTTQLRDGELGRAERGGQWRVLQLRPGPFDAVGQYLLD